MMRTFRLLAAFLLLLMPGLVRAGLYSTAEAAVGPTVTADGVRPLGFTEFRNVLGGLVQLAAERPESAERKRYLARRDDLEKKARSGRLSVEESVNLSEILIRLRQYEEAVELLTRAVAEDRRNFMALANLATAQQLAGRLDRAINYLRQALDVWPQEWPGLDKAWLQWHHEAEEYQLNLLKLRYREAAGGAVKRTVGLDNLFSDEKAPVRFVNDQDQYEPGKLAAKERAKLPADAVAIVQQLLIWEPDDTRLYWLLGELYNADGDIDAASKIFEDCVWSRRFDAAELREHRQLVKAAPVKSSANLPDEIAQISAAPTKSDSGSSPPRQWLPGGRQTVIVAGIAAAVVLLLVYFQIREMRRRKKIT